MAEYIEREAALRALCEAVHAKDGNIPCRNQLVSCLWSGTRTQEYAEKILAIPAADVVPVVRCGKCEYRKDARVNKKGFLICPASGMEITDHDYCSYGARMDGDGDA